MNDFTLKYHQPIRGFKHSIQSKILSYHRITPLSETLQRHPYSPKHNSFQMDIIHVHASKKHHQLYFVLININTRYLFIYLLKKKLSDNISKALMVFKTDIGEPINSRIADGELALISDVVLSKIY
jgi:hypothetical protein